MSIANSIFNKSTFLRKLSQGIHYKASRSGPHRLIFLVVHGNEICGVKAFLRLEKQIPIMLTSGSLEVIIANPAAFLIKSRSFNKDLNRSFLDKTLNSYESKRCELLKRSLLRADLFLDVHSTSAAGPAFILPGLYGDQLAESMPVDLVIKNLAQQCHGTTISVADKHKVRSIVVECGQHQDESAIDVAVECMTALIKQNSADPTGSASSSKKILTCPQSIVADKGFEFVSKVSFMQRFAEGELIARSNTREIRCPYPQAYIIMPNADPKEGEEAFYWGVK